MLNFRLCPTPQNRTPDCLITTTNRRKEEKFYFLNSSDSESSFVETIPNRLTSEWRIIIWLSFRLANEAISSSLLLSNCQLLIYKNTHHLPVWLHPNNLEGHPSFQVRLRDFSGTWKVIVSQDPGLRGLPYMNTGCNLEGRLFLLNAIVTSFLHQYNCLLSICKNTHHWSGQLHPT